MNKKSRRNFILNILFFVAVMVLTFWMVFREQNMGEILASVGSMPWTWLGLAVLLSVFFVSAEGVMIWYLLGKTGEKGRLFRCVAYSFVGFFFSGITPSATGGQPVQLYYMKKDGHSLSQSSVVLMTVAVIYKFVLVIIGLGMMILWNGPLREYLQEYYGLYILGLALNVVLVVILLMVMFTPALIRGILCKAEEFLERRRVLKPSETRKQKIEQFLAGYRGAVDFLRGRKGVVAKVVAGTFLQRASVFVLAYVVYRGLGLSGLGMLDITLLQASVYIAVDMLPVPGAQGITEAMYRAVFADVFARSLMPSLCVTRGISFYLVMVISLLVTVVMHMGGLAPSLSKGAAKDACVACSEPESQRKGNQYDATSKK